jgi:hypothetical protein
MKETTNEININMAFAQRFQAQLCETTAINEDRPEWKEVYMELAADAWVYCVFHFLCWGLSGDD